MPYTLRIATPATRTLVVEALRSAADQRTRVARGAARKVAEAKAAGGDVRSRAVKVTALLAEADELAELATELEQATDVPILTRASLVAEAIAHAAATPGIPEDADVDPADDAEEDDEDTGLSDEANRLADLAGLTTPIVEDGVDTTSIAEDEPDDDEVEEALKP